MNSNPPGNVSVTFPIVPSISPEFIILIVYSTITFAVFTCFLFISTFFTLSLFSYPLSNTVSPFTVTFDMYFSTDKSNGFLFTSIVTS